MQIFKINLTKVISCAAPCFKTNLTPLDDIKWYRSKEKNNEKAAIKDVTNNMVGKCKVSTQLNVYNEMKKKWEEKCEISLKKNK